MKGNLHAWSLRGCGRVNRLRLPGAKTNAMRYFTVTVWVIAGLLGAGCGQDERNDRVTPAFLLSRGFIQSKANPEHYTLEHIRLKEAAKLLGFSPPEFVPGTNAPPFFLSDIRGVVVRDYNMEIVSEEKDSIGMVRPYYSLDNLESLCSVDVWLIPQWRTNFGNGEVLFTKTGSGDAARFILQHAMALGARPVAMRNVPAIRGHWRYFENQDFVNLRLPSEQSSEVQSFLRQAFGQPAQPLLKSIGGPDVWVYSGAETNGFELWFKHCPEYAQVRMFRMEPPSETFTNAADRPERKR